MKILRKMSFLMLSALLIGATSCSEDDDDNTMTQEPEPTIYERLGGDNMVNDPANAGSMIEQGRLNLRSTVDSAIFVIAGDNRINGYFTTLLGEVGNNDLSGFAALSTTLTDFFVVATSEGMKGNYTGLDMAAAHDPAQNSRMDGKADDAAMDAFIEDVAIALTQNGVTADNSAELRADLVALLETTRSAIVQR